MHRTPLSRRTFGRLTGAAGAGLLAGGALTGTAHAATWRTTGTAVAALTAFDTQMKTFMQARGIPAGQLAVTYGGRLVLARGYSTDSTLTVQPTSLFRIASLSKPITAAAVLRLAQDGQLALDTPVTSILDLPATADARWPQITVRRLLQHLGGWDRAISGDPNFADRTISRVLGVPLELYPDDVIRYMAGRRLDHTPGTTYAYSNFGYLLAGRVIEEVSGLAYADYVRQKLLAPLGITRMAQGWSIARHTGEVPYRSQYSGVTVLDSSGATVPSPYGTFSMRVHGANGGWIASAVDLVRWARVFDQPSAVLNSASLGQVFAQPETGIGSGGSYYGLGWLVRPVSGGTGRNTWHDGSLPGTYTLMVRNYQGASWAVLFNQRDDASGLSYSDIDAALWTAYRAVTSWPSGDQFPSYF
ncbi:serine hydrolase domain-containing protein [Amycolatopsis thermoflava]|uniref:CubicO group peptidase (Beta-lactamase class C family) n=1 Tax=Amycolatopsis thermoflava TaxID=84480 RepID=A0A3N2H4K9_9PSEU|nr:serine hydrolase domain-containing protein [Amycolatopsis thermoflava]ROS43848.1 CubicO group peptidase (beta-lactamase class C family) [Amycolatopsis thermoflava]